ncbi:MAG: carbon-nitrogen hydrolase family protein [Mariprofundaceae bacterium]
MNSGDQKAANLLRAGELLAEAAEQGAKLALLPENFAFMGVDDAARRAAAEDENSSHTFAFLAEKAQRLGMFIVGGSVALRDRDSGKLRNHCPVFAPDGSCIGGYDKLHLFDVDVGDESYRESVLFQPGEKPKKIKVGDSLIGLSICYDIRFPELYRHYSAAGCTILTVPSAFTMATGKAHWETLLRARAIENQCYVLAAGQCGTHPDGRRTWGHSMIVDPWGEVIASAGEDEAVIVADFSLNHLTTIRHQLPALKHCRKIAQS